MHRVGPVGYPQLRQKSINEVKIKLANLGLALKDTPEDFDPTQLEGYDAETGDFKDPAAEDSE